MLSNFAGADSSKMGYILMEQMMNRHAGDLVYAAEGYIGFCYDGMNRVNMANNSFTELKKANVDVMGMKIYTGYKTQRLEVLIKHCFIEFYKSRSLVF